jgi:uncharacterized peroxidase-related enzyme
MSRLAIPPRDAAPAAAKPLLDAVHKQLGVVPNLFRLVANSPVALSAFASFRNALEHALDAKTRERIAIAVAEVNGCAYCLSAHSYVALNMAKMGPEEIALNRHGASADVKANAAVSFAAKVAREHGHVADADIALVREAGFTDAQIVEIVALVALNSFTNYLNEVAKTEVDFPAVDIRPA